MKYITEMIESFAHKPLRALFETGKSAKIDRRLHAKILMRLDALDAAGRPEDMDIPGFKFHGLHGRPKRYSVWVTGNFRLTFGWDGTKAVQVDFEDYH